MRSKFTLAVLSGAVAISLASFGAQANGTGVVNFTGSVIDAPCGIAPESADQTVNFGQLPLETLQEGTAMTPVAFALTLTNCTTTTSNAVTVQFDGATDGTNLSELSTTGGTGVAVTIGSSSGTGDIAFGTPDTALPIAAGTNTLNYSASVKKATGSLDVTPGDFTAVANFTLAYQ